MDASWSQCLRKINPFKSSQQNSANPALLTFLFHGTIGIIFSFLDIEMWVVQILAGLLNPNEGFFRVKKPRSYVFQNPDHQVDAILVFIS